MQSNNQGQIRPEIIGSCVQVASWFLKKGCPALLTEYAIV